MHLESVDDLEDRRLAGYRSLKDSTLAARLGRFVVEGRANLELLLEASPFRPESILLSPRAFAALEARLRRSDPDCPVFVAPQPVLDAVVGFPIHRGCLALCPRPPARDPLELARAALGSDPAPRLLALDGLTNHDNVGGIFRNARAFGARGVVLCPRTCDPLYRKAVRTSMGGTLRVPFARAAEWPGTLRSLRGLGYEVLALDPDPGSVALDALTPQDVGAAVLVLGTEGPGLGDGIRRLADRRVRIPMEPGVDSLNVAVAAAIAIHRLHRGLPGSAGLGARQSGAARGAAPKGTVARGGGAGPR